MTNPAKIADGHRGNCHCADCMTAFYKWLNKRDRLALRLYPSTGLKEPVREFQSTVFELVKKTFNPIKEQANETQ